MNPITRKDATRHIGAPKDWIPGSDQGECGVLSVLDLETSQGPYMESIWVPTPEELTALNAGHGVVLGVRGTGHPVVYVAVSQETIADLSPVVN